MTKEKRARRRRTQDARRKTQEGSTTTGTETYRMSIFVISTCMCYFDITIPPSQCVFIFIFHVYFRTDRWTDGYGSGHSRLCLCLCLCVCVECHMGKGEDQ